VFLKASHPRDEEQANRTRATSDEPTQRGQRAEEGETEGTNARAKRERTLNSKPRDSVASKCDGFKIYEVANVESLKYITTEITRV